MCTHNICFEQNILKTIKLFFFFFDFFFFFFILQRKKNLCSLHRHIVLLHQSWSVYKPSMYLFSKSWKSPMRSAILNPFLVALEEYAGPIPLLVVPILQNTNREMKNWPY